MSDKKEEIEETRRKQESKFDIKKGCSTSIFLINLLNPGNSHIYEITYINTLSKVTLECLLCVQEFFLSYLYAHAKTQKKFIYLRVLYEHMQ